MATCEGGWAEPKAPPTIKFSIIIVSLSAWSMVYDKPVLVTKACNPNSLED